MLRLSIEQAERLEELTLKRHAAGIAEVLAQVWPAVTERLKERWPAFVEAALLQAGRHGLRHPQDLAGYAGLCCLWGAAFEDKPGFEWAQEILADGQRGAALKVHQLAHASRAELLRRQPAAGAAVVAAPPLTPAHFDTAWATVDRQVAALAAARAVFPQAEPRISIQPCDVSTVDARLAEVELQEYRLATGTWQRVAAPKLALPALHWTRAPDEPVRLAVPSQPLRGGPPARLNLRLQPQAVCDPRLHPQVVHTAEAGRLAWKGRDAQQLSLAMYALPPAPLDPRAGPAGIAAPTPADVQKIELASCGLRDAGAPFGPLALQVEVVPATQWLTEIRHPAWPAMAWPLEAPPTAPAPTCRLEADGKSTDATAWQRGWAGLHRAAVQGLEKLFNAWLKAQDATTPRLEAELAPLVGQAALTWGWRRVEAARVAMRCEGQLDLLACTLDLRLTCELAQGGARARVTLACQGRSELRLALAQLGDEADEGRGLGDAQREWRFPFRLDVEPLAGAELATLSAGATPEPLLGAIAGSAGLRPRPDGAGWQWFFSLRVEPVSAVLVVADPLLGGGTVSRSLLPSMTLVEWSAG